MTRHPDTSTDLPERNLYLVVLALPAAIWMMHFMLSYAAVSIWCSKFADTRGTLAGFQPLIFGFTVVVLGIIGAIGWHGFRRHRHGREAAPHDLATPEDRHRFLGFATMLIAGLSAIATIFVSLSFVFVDTCR